MKNKPKKRIITIIFLIIGIGLLIYVSINLYNWYKDYKNITDINKDNENTNISDINNGNNTQDEDKIDPNDPYWKYINIPLMQVDFNELKQKNSDTVAWLKVDNTNINYPVVRSKNNSYYLNHSYNKKYNSAGWIFMDYKNNSKDFDKNSVIYGHARRDKTMFGTLRKTVTKSWYKDTNNHIIKISTPYEDTLWQVFSTYTIKKESYYLTTSFPDKNIFNEWANTMLKRSVHNFNTTINENDKVLTLSSCYTSYDSERIVLHAKLIKSNPR